MDTITQGLLGAVTAQLGFRQRIGRDATLVAAAAAVAPDLDFLLGPIVGLSGSESAEMARIVGHRGLSHSLLIVPLIALAIAAAWWWFRRSLWEPAEVQERRAGPGFGWLFGCVLAAVASHPLLDWFTSYGTQLFSPVTSARFALDAVPIVDLIYTPILIVTLAACYIVRKWKSQAARATLAIGWSGFLLSTGYLLAGLALHEVAIGQAKRTIEELRGVETQRSEYAAYPQPGSIFVWRVVRRTPETWTAGRVNVRFGPVAEPSRWTSAAVENNAWIAKAGQRPEVREFIWFTGNHARATYENRDGHHIVEFHDMRYGLTPGGLESLWSIRAVISPLGNVLDVERVEHHRGVRRGEMIGRFWGYLWEA